ncbi:hypothetical protein C8A03DRAFT_33376 [Achaetomium macrosporum]|uniref:Uncharacterized protein n=1 Tax=Achaetomium macrosporum TaxID=79813 RepID=A0AAN7HBE2_9PEZI|nr:hypothetical protein C8A03DRAFT_33376 [Achaetomium macrosporum]
MAKRVLLWVVFCLEPLTLQELNVGIALARLWKPDSPGRIDNEMVKFRLIRPTVFKAVLYRACGQLPRISSHNRVELVHRTLSQYLATKPEFFRIEHPDWLLPYHGRFYLPDQESHAALRRRGVGYLMMGPFANSGAEFVATDKGRTEWETKVQARINDYEFVRPGTNEDGQFWQSSGASKHESNSSQRGYVGVQYYAEGSGYHQRLPKHHHQQQQQQRIEQQQQQRIEQQRIEQQQQQQKGQSQGQQKERDCCCMVM